MNREPVRVGTAAALEVGETPVNCVHRWGFVESAVVPAETVPALSCNRAYTVEIPIVVQKAIEAVWRPVNSCSPPFRGEEDIVVQQKVKFELSEQRCCLDSHDS